MIYRNSYFRKEERQAYVDNTIGLRRKLSLALFTGLVAFAVFFALQTLTNSVLSDAVPEIMQPSFFSTIYIYIHIVLVSFMIYYIVLYDYLFFSEIRRNAWYLLIQMRYRPIRMIFDKLAALLYSVFIVYSAGFAVTVMLTVFLKYSFVPEYMPSLYIAGLTDIFVLTALSLCVSLFAKRREDARLLVLASAVLVIILKVITGAYGVLRNRVVMQDLGNLIDTGRSWYFPVAIMLFVLCMGTAVVRAQRLARFYSHSGFEWDDLPEGVAVVRIDSATGRLRENRRSGSSDRSRKLAGAAVTALLILFILAALAFNVLVILISTATPGNEITIRGTIPYVFQSDTMEPDIMLNDLAFFRKVDVQYPVEKGQIVLFKDNNIVYVERIARKLDTTLEVDIDHYPAGAEEGAMVKQIPRSAVYGVYSGRSRWLGALILFANTIVGRLLFLLMPAVLLFARKRISTLYRRNRE
jgi:hypothetical protein